MTISIDNFSTYCRSNGIVSLVYCLDWHSFIVTKNWWQANILNLSHVQHVGGFSFAVCCKWFIDCVIWYINWNPSSLNDAFRILHSVRELFASQNPCSFDVNAYLQQQQILWQLFILKVKSVRIQGTNSFHREFSLSFST